MAAQAVFRGAVDEGGRLKLEDRPRLTAHLQGLAGKPVELVVRKPKSKRSTVANNWHWGIAVPMIAEALGYERNEHDQVHYALVSKCFGVRQDPLLGEVPNKRSSKLSTEEFSYLMEWEVRFAAEFLGIVIPLPSEAEAA